MMLYEADKGDLWGSTQHVSAVCVRRDRFSLRLIIVDRCLFY